MPILLAVLVLLSFVEVWGLPGQGCGRGQFSGWMQLREEDWDENEFGIRYIPELSWSEMRMGGMELDVEAALEGRYSGRFHWLEGNLDEYRLWGRLAGDQYEMRVGLQKIEFGPATLLRPLMWFDRIDPRDPLGMTGGVWAALGRYYFLNNANFWMWVVRGEGGTGGMTLLPSDEGDWEIGGRGQVPVGTGEVGVTVHARKVVANTTPLPSKMVGVFPEDRAVREEILKQFEDEFPAAIAYFPDGVLTEEGLAAIAAAKKAAKEPFREWRLGLDGRWDRVIGMWLEGMAVYQDAPRPLFRHMQMLTVGADYTVGIGNGVHVLGEQMVVGIGDEPFDGDQVRQISAVSVSYTPGVFDRLTGIGYYDWEEETAARYVSWGRLYDRWSFYLNGFWNSGDAVSGGGSTAREGKGIQLMVVFNHGEELW